VLKAYIGCSGWSYSAWQGHFYPKRLEPRNYLEYYSRVFGYVEVDSTFYRTPNLYTALRWSRLTPDNFRFTAKFPQVVTHDTRLGGGLEGLLHFFEIMKPLEQKLLCLLIQLPPSLNKDEGLPKLERLIPHLWKKYRYAIEVRHHSWFTKEVYDLLKKNEICLVWSQLDAIRTPPKLTTDFFYLRFIGDKRVEEKDSSKIQKNRLKEIERWAEVVKKESKKAAFGIVAANNDYNGFAPATTNDFRKMVELPELVWGEKK
jgi:uncharacterized protein YecE (DUF72 family)